jgi:hypothetical protein
MVSGFVQSRSRTSAVLAAVLCWCAVAAGADPGQNAAGQKDHGPNDYPTYARVQYVQECMARGGGGLADLYKCSCVIDRLAEHLTYDDFVEASTFARYATLPGEGGGIFRDPERAKEQAKLYRTLEADAYRGCGLKPPAGAGR